MSNDADPLVTVAPDELQSVRVYVALDKGGVAALPEATQEFSFTVSDSENGTQAEHRANFQGPEE